MMKIAVWHNLPSGGGKRALHAHVRGLVERGHSVEVWSPPTADLAYCPLGELAREHVVPLSWPDNWRSKIFGALQHGASLGKIDAMARHCQRCAEEINLGGFDLLFVNSCMYFGAAPIARHVRLPSMAYLQEPCRFLYEALPTLGWVAPDGPRAWWDSGFYLGRRLVDTVRTRGHRLQAREEFRNARAFSSILVNSYYSRESFLRAYGLNSDVCHLGVDPDLFKDQNAPREDFVIGIGAFAAVKNIHFIIRALARLPQPRPRLVWVGNFAVGSYLDELALLACSEKVTFQPKMRIGDQELVDLLNRAKMMLYAPRLEPFGFAPLEANACALPVVAVAEGGVRETVIDGVNGLLVSHDPSAMAAAAKRLLDCPDYGRELGRNGHRIVAERWTANQSVDRLEDRLVETLRRVNRDVEREGHRLGRPGERQGTFRTAGKP